MPPYPSLVNLAWDVLNQFLKDWQTEPYRWSKESDIQTELTTRLGTVYRLLGSGLVQAKYEDVVKGFEGRQFWSRVCSEPTVRYQWQGANASCYPDVAVLDDIADPNFPPDANEEGTFPLLWVCEIKLNPRPGVQKEGEWDDLTKIRTLLQQGRPRFACCLTMYRQRAEFGSGIEWDKREERLWQCAAKLPALAPG